MRKLHTIIFTLKQHTPLIHFQHEQEDATLRASEVKPRLDEFIIKVVGETKIPPNWKAKWENVENGIKSLNYKIEIDVLKGTNNYSVVIIPPNRDNCILHLHPIKLKIVSLEQSLINEIKKQISYFFLLTSFGKRQNKGFGCFYPISVEENNKTNEIKEFQNWMGLEMFLKKYSQPVYLFNETIISGNTPFDQRNSFYQVVSEKWRILKSGFNHGGVYKKSAIFEYLCSQKLRWDKRWIKKEIQKLIVNKTLPYNLKNKLKKGKPNEPNDCSKQSWIDDPALKYEYRFGRAMLGLAEHFEFLTSNEDCKYKIIVESKEVERFKAPVIFKIFNNNLFAILDEVSSEIFDKPLNFTVQTKKKVYNESSGKDEWVADSSISEFDLEDASKNKLILKTPTVNEFNYQTFLDTYFMTVGFDRINI